MRLTLGTKLGQYEVVEPMGAGGMGEVYRARDKKLGRDVAIKVLPDAFAKDRERLDRFEREAKLLAQLNHTNIATLYGLEEEAGQQFIVMELVKGETLAERIARGPIPLDEALPLFIQVAEGLEAAHGKGIIHRDLKPANIKITPEGKIKILDFGLAKAFATEENVSAETSQSPTLTRGTALGAIVGTAAYMSPEQARGKSVDKRTDIWAFGCCLYEALAGAKAFEGDTVSDILAAVLKNEPKWEALPPLPVRVDLVLRQCLEKDQAKRLHHIIDGRITLDGAAAEDSVGTAVAPASPGSSLASRVVMAVSLAIGALGVWSLLTGGGNSSDPPRVRRLSIPLPEGASFAGLSGLNASSLALSPSGDRLAFAVSVDGVEQLFMRPMDAAEVTPLPGTEGATQPFFSPDGEWVGFVNDRGIAKVSVHGGPVIGLTDFRAVRIVGATWGPDGEIFFSAMGHGLLKVAEDGGAEETVLQPDPSENEVHIHYPEILPGGDALLITVGRTEGHKTSIELLTLRDGSRSRVIDDGRRAKYVASGHLLFERSRSMMVVPFDRQNYEISGTPGPAAEGVYRGTDFAVSIDGTLAYVSGDLAMNRLGQLFWVDREGATTPIGDPRSYSFSSPPRISPDGTRLAIGVNIDDGPDIWVHDLMKESFQRITVALGPSATVSPLWSPDGDTLYVRSDRTQGIWRVFAVPSDGSRRARQIADVEFAENTSITSDGSTLVITDLEGDIATLSTEGDTQPTKIVASSFDEHSGMLSPNDRWLAYVSNESGRAEVYVRSFPGLEGKFLVSVNGGSEPMWSKDGNELFYRRGDELYGVKVSDTDGFRTGAPKELFEGQFRRPLNPRRSAYYDVHPDGSRFVMLKNESRSFPAEIHVVVNWFEELKRRVPVDK